ncbi:hypothetical protein GCM10009606_25820 [Nocardioides aquiterrae]|uniref:Methyltransferase domain-containing protein n=2 Tax=Nocardioides aquiterrae TaxID=203799 RepID=A0ABP4F2J1_9ACTN
MDLVIAVPLAAVLSPFAVAVGLAIKRQDKGPALYPAKRVGAEGVEFTMYKFRTMVTDADAIGGASTSARDPRITPVGHFLRRWKLDELPQLINVIRGDMSLVGPRPTLDWDVARYSEGERRLLSVKPGITDWASIRFRDEGEILKDEVDPDEAYDRLIRPEKIRLSLMYVDHASLRQDASILVATAKALFGHEPVHGRPGFDDDRAKREFFKITEDWSTKADQQQWELARQRYSLAAALGRGKVLAEVGCGTGYGLAQVARFTKSAVGIDIDEWNLAIARERAPECDFLLGDAEAMPFRDAELDCLVGLEMLYYLPHPEVFIAEAARTLRPGGHLLVSMPSPERTAFKASPFSTRYLTAAELNELLDQEGFDVEAYGSCPVGGSSPAKELVRRALVRMHLIPRTIEGRAKLKAVVFRNMRTLESIEVDPERAFDGLSRLDHLSAAHSYAITVMVGTRRSSSR